MQNFENTKSSWWRDFSGTQISRERQQSYRRNRNFVNVRFSNRRQECRRSRDVNSANFRSRGNAFSYNFDEIGNRTENLPNELNQPTIIGDFVPAFDADGNMIALQTSTGTWSISWNSENRPIRFENAGTQTVIECAYDYLGRRFEKKVTIAGTATSHQRYIYRGFLQIACLDCLRSAHPDIWLVLWDPTQSAGTRPLAIQKDGAYFTFGWDITKNIWEVFGQNGYIRTSYSYDPFGNVSESGDVSQPFQWSSEFYDSELALVYYNYRYYIPALGRWLSEDPIGIEGGLNLYGFVGNAPVLFVDSLGQACSVVSLSDKTSTCPLKSLGNLKFTYEGSVIGQSKTCWAYCPKTGRCEEKIERSYTSSGALSVTVSSYSIAQNFSWGKLDVWAGWQVFGTVGVSSSIGFLASFSVFGYELSYEWTSKDI